MVPLECLADLALQIEAVLAYGIPGAFVECGVWRGGASFLMADLLRRAGERDRRVWMFDSFEGIPPPAQIDGPDALDWATNRNGPLYFDNLCVSLEEVQRTAVELGLISYVELVNGPFERTLSENRHRIGPVAVLRIDCDWYSSVRCCLDNLYDLVVDGGFVIFDDYYAYDGCAIAVHEFLGKRRLPHRLESVLGDENGIEGHQIALFRKGRTEWKWMSQVCRAHQEIAALVPLGSAFILADEDKWETGEFVLGHRRIPFLEKDGHYWGKPLDSETAIREVERLRQAGAAFIVFAWPSFWWLDY